MLRLFNSLFIVKVSIMMTMGYSIIITFACVNAQAPISVPLKIREGVNSVSYSVIGYPVSVVVPFAEGAIFDKDSLSINEGNPCQVEVLETWMGDGSIRHALVHFQAKLTARQVQTLTLINDGPTVKPKPAQPVQVTDTTGYIQVDTGKVRFRISKTSFNLLDQVWFDQNENQLYEASEQMIFSSATNGGFLVPRTGAGSTQRDSARTDIEVVIEETGPLRVVVKVSAPTLYESTTDHLHGFAVRFYAYAGLADIKIDYQLQNSAGNAVRSWPLYFEEMGIDLQFNFSSGISPSVTIGNTVRRVVNATSRPARIRQTRHNSSTIEHGGTVVQDINKDYNEYSKNAAFVHLQGGSTSTGVTIAMRNFWQMWPNGLVVDASNKVSIEMFPIWSAQYVTHVFRDTCEGGWPCESVSNHISTTGLYWLNDMQHVYKEFVISFHKTAPSTTQLFDLTRNLQFPPVVTMSPNYHRTTKATLDMGGLLPSNLASMSTSDTFSPDSYWDESSLDESSRFYKGNWVNFGDVEGEVLAASCEGIDPPHDAEYLISTDIASLFYLYETWGIGELNVRPQSMPSYNFNADYERLMLSDASYCNGSWRLFAGGTFKFAAPFLNDTGLDAQPSYGARTDRYGWFYHAAQSYFYTGNYWMRDWYEFVGQFRRVNLASKVPFQDYSARGIAHSFSHSLQAARITNDTALYDEMASFFRNHLRPRHDKLYGSFFNTPTTNEGGGDWGTGYLMMSIINYMLQIQKKDIQLYAELFNYLSGLVEWNLNIGNFPGWHNQYIHGTTKPSSAHWCGTIVCPQTWYFWITGRIEFWNHVEAYMNGELGEEPFGAPWTEYPDKFVPFNTRTYIFVKENFRSDLTPPNPIADLVGSYNSGKSVTLQWTSPATSTRYHVVWSDKPIVGTYSTSSDVSNWWAANAVGISIVATPGSKQLFTTDILYETKPVYVAIFSFDENSNMSMISNIAQVGVALGPIPLPATIPIPSQSPFITSLSPSANIKHVYPRDKFADIVENAQPGDIIIVHQGEHYASSRISIRVQGTGASPVVIRGAEGEFRPLILRLSTSKTQNTIDIEGATFLTIQGLEILSNGGNGINLIGSPAYITLDDLVIRDVPIGINAEANVRNLIARNCSMLNNGKGLHLGCHDGSCAVSDSTIEGNLVYGPPEPLGSGQGDGIALSVNSFGNIIRDNVIYSKNRGIVLYGSGSGKVNIVDGNVMWSCEQGGIQVTADAVVQNNIVLNAGYGFVSNVQNGVSPKNLKIVHNTLVKNTKCLSIRNWNGRSDIIFANNAVYCDTDTMDVQGGMQSVILSGNMFYPNATVFPSGSYKVGREYSQDFEDLDSKNAYPSSTSRLRNAATTQYTVYFDFDGVSRFDQEAADVGAYEWTAVSGRKWNVSSTFKPFIPRPPTRPPTVAVSKQPVVAPVTVVPVPTVSPPTKVPAPCGLFRLRIFCPFTLCGIFGRLLGLCKT